MIIEEIKDYPPYLDYPKPYKPITNADRIRSMNDEELAEIIACPKGLFDRMECFDYSRNCEDCILEWLQQQAEEDKHEP